MKKLLVGLFLSALMSTGLVALGTAPATADQHCYPDSAQKTSTLATPLSPARPNQARIFVQVTSFEEGKRNGKLNIVLVRRTGNRAVSYSFERRYNSDRAPRGKEYRFSGLRRGNYAAFVSFVPNNDCKWKPSSGAAKNVQVRGQKWFRKNR